MFEPNERVQCIDASPDYFNGVAIPSGLVEKRIYVVQGFMPAFSLVDMTYEINVDCIRIGVLDGMGVDCHTADRFRKLNPKDYSEGLATLIGLTETTRLPEVVSA